MSASLSSATVRAESVEQILHRLTPYDLEGARSLDALDALAAQAGKVKAKREQEVLSFLHTMASVDLWMIARVTSREALEVEVAERFGVEPAALPNVLAQALSPLRQSIYKASVDDALQAVAMMSSSQAAATSRGDGTRSSLAYMRALVAELASAEDAVRALAGLSADPCPRPDSCDARYARFDRQGRSAVAALELGARAYQRLHAVREQDPLVSAVSAHVDELFSTLRALQLRPGLRMARGPICPAEAACGERGRVDLVAFIEEDRLLLAFVPRAHITEDGDLQVAGLGEPLWPQTRHVPLPKSYPAFLRHINELVSTFSELRAGGQVETIAIGAAASTRAHVWGRVMLSARRAGFEEPMALGRSPSGEARVQPVRLVTAFAAPQLEPSELSVMMLMKGYSVKFRGPAMAIDRVPTEDGGYRFDFSALVERAKPSLARNAYLRFLPDIAANDLLNTTFAVAPADRQVTVILP